RGRRARTGRRGGSPGRTEAAGMEATGSSGRADAGRGGTSRRGSSPIALPSPRLDERSSSTAPCSSFYDGYPTFSRGAAISPEFVDNRDVGRKLRGNAQPFHIVWILVGHLHRSRLVVRDARTPGAQSGASLT